MLNDNNNTNKKKKATKLLLNNPLQQIEHDNVPFTVTQCDRELDAVLFSVPF